MAVHKVVLIERDEQPQKTEVRTMNTGMVRLMHRGPFSLPVDLVPQDLLDALVEIEVIKSYELAESEAVGGKEN